MRLPLWGAALCWGRHIPEGSTPALHARRSMAVKKADVCYGAQAADPCARCADMKGGCVLSGADMKRGCVRRVQQQVSAHSTASEERIC